MDSLRGSWPRADRVQGLLRNPFPGPSGLQELLLATEEEGGPQVALVVENLPASAADSRDTGSIPGPGRSPGEGNSNPLQYSCLETSMNRGAWQATVQGVAKSRTPLSN